MISALRGGKIMALANGEKLLVGQTGNGEIGFYASFMANDDWATNIGVDFTGWDSI